MIELGVATGPDAAERRSYESLIVSAIEDQAVGLAVLRPLALGAVESVTASYARAFAAAEVSGGRGAVTPAVLASVARQLIRRGESLHLIDVDTAGRVALREVASWTVTGGPQPEGWRYQATMGGPTATVTRHVGADGVVHAKYSVDPARPWAGRGPLQWATETGRLGAALEAALADESDGPRGKLIAVPVDGGDGGENDPLADLKRDIRTLRGRAALVETTAAGWAEGRAAAPQKDWVPRRLGADPPAALIELRTAVEVTIAGACGVPAVLLSAGGDGTARREGYRQFLHGSIEPLARLVEQELTDKLEGAVRLSFRRLEAGDVTGRARAWRSLVGKDGAMDADRAAELTGLD